MRSAGILAVAIALTLAGAARRDAADGPARGAGSRCAPIACGDIGAGILAVSSPAGAAQAGGADGARAASARAASARAAEPTRFLALDIIVDSGDAPLGAYQFEYIGSAGAAGAGGAVKLVGVEGGEAAPFAEAPHYDPRALAGGRVIVGAFSTAANLPRGAVRVARLHLAVEGAIEGADGEAAGDIQHAIKLMTAGDGAGAPIDATVRYQQVEAP